MGRSSDIGYHPFVKGSGVGKDLGELQILFLTFDLKDEKTGEVFDTVVYPDDLEQDTETEGE